MTPRTSTDKGAGPSGLVESFMSGLKRTTGKTLSAAQECSQMTEAALRVRTYALRR